MLDEAISYNTVVVCTEPLTTQRNRSTTTSTNATTFSPECCDWKLARAQLWQGLAFNLLEGYGKVRPR